MRLIIIYIARGWRAAMPSHHINMRTFYIDHHGWLNAWLRSRLGNAADAADLAQDTFLRLLNRHELLELKAPRAFLRTVARGIVIDHWRREELERAYLEAIAHQPCHETPSPESRQLVLELLESIAKMLDGLKPKVRQAFLLAQCEGMPYKQIAEQMSVSLRSLERYIADALYHCYLLRYAP